MLNFPASPSVNQVFTSGRSWMWDGTKWIVPNLSSPTTPLVVHTSTVLANGFIGIVVVENTTGAPIVITLPGTPLTEQAITVKDAAGNASVNKITISGNGFTLDGFSTWDILTSSSWVNFVFIGTKWVQC